MIEEASLLAGHGDWLGLMRRLGVVVSGDGGAATHAPETYVVRLEPGASE